MTSPFLVRHREFNLPKLYSEMVAEQELNRQPDLSTIHHLSESNKHIYFAKLSDERIAVDKVGKMD